jgi:hypothetical protein
MFGRGQTRQGYEARLFEGWPTRLVLGVAKYREFGRLHDQFLCREDY